MLTVRRPLLWLASAFVLGELTSLPECGRGPRLISLFCFLFICLFLLHFKNQKQAVSSAALTAVLPISRSAKFRRLSSCPCQVSPRKPFPFRRLLDFRQLFSFRILLFLFFFLGMYRASSIASDYHTPEKTTFFSQYQPRNEGEFDYSLYLKSCGVSSEEERKQFREGGLLAGNLPYFSQLGQIKQLCTETLDAVLPEKDEGIYRALLLGDKSEMDERQRSLYQSQGIAPLLAVSGLHLSIIRMGFYRLLQRMGLGLNSAGLTASTLVLSYGFLTGAQGSAMRAVIMLLVRFLSLRLGKSYDTLSALSFAALLLAFVQPYLLLQSGFQLSFSAIFSISLLGGHIIHTLELGRTNRSAGFNRMKPRCSCRISDSAKLPSPAKALLISLCIQFFTLPVILYHFFVFPLYGILLNFLVIPLMVFVILSGLLVLFFGISGTLLSQLLADISVSYLSPEETEAFFHLLAKACGGAGHYILLFYENLCELTASLPHSSLVLGQPEASDILCYYGLLALCCCLFFNLHSLMPHHFVPKHSVLRHFVPFRSRPFSAPAFSPLKRCTLFFCSLLFLAALLFAKPGPSLLTVKAVDVGQGDSFLLRFRSQNILIDAGSSSEKELGKYTLRPFLLSQGIAELDAVFISHSDLDHTSGLLYLLREVPEIHIKELVLPEAADNSDAYDELKDLFRQKPVPRQYHNAADTQSATANISYLSVNDVYPLSDNISLRCLYAGRRNTPEVNAHSPVLLLQYGSFSMLFTGDMTKGDEALLAKTLRNKTSPQDISSTLATHEAASLQHIPPAPTIHQAAPPQNISSTLTVYKAAHHGSKTSNSDALLKLFRPRYALISCGAKNSYGHPHKEVTDRFARYSTALLQTAECGQINLKTNGKTLWIHAPFRPLY